MEIWPFGGHFELYKKSDTTSRHGRSVLRQLFLKKLKILLIVGENKHFIDKCSKFDSGMSCRTRLPEKRDIYILILNHLQSFA